MHLWKQLTARMYEGLTYLGSLLAGFFSALTIQDISASIGVVVSVAFTAMTYIQHRRTERAKREFFRQAAVKLNDAVEFTKGAQANPAELPRHIDIIARVIDKIDTLEPQK